MPINLLEQFYKADVIKIDGVLANMEKVHNFVEYVHNPDKLQKPDTLLTCYMAGGGVRHFSGYEIAAFSQMGTALIIAGTKIELYTLEKVAG